MGQYFTPICIHRTGLVKKFDAHNYASGYKLTEHSWIGNELVGAVMNYLASNNCYLAWVGDYAGDGENDNKYKKKDDFQEVFKYYERQTGLNWLFCGSNLDTTKGYLWNKTKNEYLDMKEYIMENKEQMPMSLEVKCVHPLPLLTSIGNGAGGGDYFGTDEEYVGSWACDEIVWVQKKPGEEAKKILPHFKQRELE